MNLWFYLIPVALFAAESRLECPICFDEIEVHDQVRRICDDPGHLMHAACADRIPRHLYRCTICRQTSSRSTSSRPEPAMTLHESCIQTHRRIRTHMEQATQEANKTMQEANTRLREANKMRERALRAEEANQREIRNLQEREEAVERNLQERKEAVERHQLEASTRLQEANTIQERERRLAAEYERQRELRPIDPNKVDEYGFTPLTYAIRYRDFAFVEEFLAQPPRGFKINAQDGNGRTALHMAIMYNKVDIAKLLIDLGAKIWIRDIHGERPYFYSRTREMDDLILEVYGTRALLRTWWRFPRVIHRICAN